MNKAELSGVCRQMRRDIINMTANAGSGHPGGSLSAVELMASVFYNHMRIDPENPRWEDRDRFVLSKGHAAPCYYAVLAELGFISRDEFKNFRQLHSILQGHPDCKKVPGVDASTGKETGLELIRQIYPTLGMVPGLILAPGWSHTPTVAAALQAKTENINGNFNCSCLLDISADSDGAVVYTSVKDAKEALGASSAHAAALWPMVAVGEKKYYFSAMFAALTAYTDANNADVPYESPSNKDLRITATVLKDGTTVALDQQQANDVLNANGVITAINANGFKSWGNNTAAYPSTTDPKDRWWAVRRFFDWDGNNFIQTYFQKVDKPGNKRLIQSIVDSQNIIGNGYVARDYCAGYRVEFRSDENPVTNLLAGHLTVHTYLAPYIPAEYIENIREYDVDALESAIGGE